jgi:hypothetical protein
MNECWREGGNVNSAGGEPLMVKIVLKLNIPFLPIIVAAQNECAKPLKI